MLRGSRCFPFSFAPIGIFVKNNTLTDRTVYEMVGQLYTAAYCNEANLVTQYEKKLEELQQAMAVLKRENDALKEMIDSIQKDKASGSQLSN